MDSMKSTAEAIDLDRVTKRYLLKTSLNNLSLRVPKGVVFGLLGPNGAGKTTAMRVMLGLVKPTCGNVSVLGLDPGRNGKAIRQQVGVLLEGDGLYSRLTGWQNLKLHARLHHLRDQEWIGAARNLLASMDLSDRHEERVSYWSKGMRVKLALVRALLHKPRLLLLDEPFAGLDPVAAVQFRERIVDLAKQHGVTVLLAAHDLGHVEKACDLVAVMRSGGVIAQGNPDQLGRTKASKAIRLSLSGAGLDETMLATLHSLRLVQSYKSAGMGFTVICNEQQRGLIGKELMHRGVALDEMRTFDESLEESFVSLMAVEEQL